MQDSEILNSGISSRRLILLEKARISRLTWVVQNLDRKSALEVLQLFSDPFIPGLKTLIQGACCFDSILDDDEFSSLRSVLISAINFTSNYGFEKLRHCFVENYSYSSFILSLTQEATKDILRSYRTLVLNVERNVVEAKSRSGNFINDADHVKLAQSIHEFLKYITGQMLSRSIWHKSNTELSIQISEWSEKFLFTKFYGTLMQGTTRI